MPVDSDRMMPKGGQDKKRQLSWTPRRPVNGIFVFLALVINCAHSVMFDSFATPWTVAHQVPLSMGFPRQEYWSDLSFPSLGESSQSRGQIHAPALTGRLFTTEPPRKSLTHAYNNIY